VGAGAGAAGHDRAAAGTALEHHLGFHRGSAAGIEHLPGHDGVNHEVEGVDHSGLGVSQWSLKGILWVAPAAALVPVGTEP